MSKKPSGFYSKGSGQSRKVIPVFAPHGHTTHSKFIDPSREQMHQMRHTTVIKGSPLDRGTKHVIKSINSIPGLSTTSSCSGLHKSNVGAHIIIRHDRTFKRSAAYIQQLSAIADMRKTHPPGRRASKYDTYVVTPRHMTPKQFWIALDEIFVHRTE